MSTTAVTWPASPGWYWAFGRIGGMREAALMSARALMEGDQLIVYVGEAMTHRLAEAARIDVRWSDLAGCSTCERRRRHAAGRVEEKEPVTLVGGS